MNDDRILERRIASTYEETAPGREPAGLLDDILLTTSRTRQRPHWLALIKEPPMRYTSHLAVGSPTARAVAILAATLLATLLVASAGIAGARLIAASGTIVVDPSGDGTVETIAEAVAMAADGDTIVIRPGTYAEALVIDKDITLRGDGADRSAVVIEVPMDAPHQPEELATRCLMGCSGTDTQPTGLLFLETTSSLSNVTVVGRAEGSAVSIHGGAPTLEDLTIEIEGDVAPTTRQVLRGGLHIDNASRAIVRGITHEGWLSVDRGSSPIFEDNQLLDSCVHLWGEGTVVEFRRNTVTACPNGWALDIAHGATPLVEDNDISAAGIYVYPGIAEGTHPIIRRNRVHDAEPQMDIKGIRIDAGATATIEDNEIFGNANGIEVTGADATIRDNDIHDNEVGVSLTDASPILEDNAIGSNQVGLALSGSASHPQLSGNVICDNETNVRLVGDAVLGDVADNEVCA